MVDFVKVQTDWSSPVSNIELVSSCVQNSTHASIMTQKVTICICEYAAMICSVED